MSVEEKDQDYTQPGRFYVAFNSLVAITFLLPIHQVWLTYANVPAFKPHPIQPPLRHRELRRTLYC